jgi:hypothetical protein
MKQSKVFISYSHDSEGHKNRVYNLSEKLRKDGIDCHIDQYEISPLEGWARWTRNQIRQADFVLVVCTETYERRYEGTEAAGKGAGAKWEGGIITQELYESEGHNSKFIPVVFSAQDTTHIPLDLRRGTFHIVDSEKGYKGLYRHLTGQPAAVKGALGKLRPMPALKRREDFSRSSAEKPAGRAADTSGTRAPKARVAKSAARKPQARSSQSLVLIISPEGHPLFVEASRIESAATNISMHLLTGDPKQAASIDSLRRSTRGQPIAVAFGTTALWARVVSVKQVVERGGGVWELELQPDENANRRSNVLTEYSFNNYSPDYIAELRARRILLDEKLPDALGVGRGGVSNLDAGLLEHAVEGGYGSRIQVKDSPLPTLFSALKGDSAQFLATAKLNAVLLLLLTNTIERIDRLELRLKGGAKLSVKFEGQRTPRYSNRPPHVIKVEGTFDLTERG